MKNFIFKSTSADLHKILFNKLDMLLAEQRKQRMDLTTIIRMITVNKVDNDLQKQVDDYFEEDDKEQLPPPDEDTAEHIPEV